MKFKGDIIITDPAYIIKEEDYNKAKFGLKEFLAEKQKEAGELPAYPDRNNLPLNEYIKIMAETNLRYSKYIKKAFDLENEWRYTNYFKNLGFTTFLMNTTYYGDWSCTTFEKETNKVLGQFCADAGEVCVLLLDEVLKYNPTYQDEIGTWCATIIKDFDGDISFDIKEECTIVETDNGAYQDIDTNISVIGKGNINFYTAQTGL